MRSFERLPLHYFLSVLHKYVVTSWSCYLRDQIVWSDDSKYLTSVFNSWRGKTTACFSLLLATMEVPSGVKTTQKNLFWNGLLGRLCRVHKCTEIAKRENITLKKWHQRSYSLNIKPCNIPLKVTRNPWNSLICYQWEYLTYHF